MFLIKFITLLSFISKSFGYQPDPINATQYFAAPGLKIDALTNFATARGVNTEPGSNGGVILVLARDANKIVCLVPSPSLDIGDTKRVDLLNITQPSQLPELMFSHGLAVDPTLKWLYVSTGTTIWRFQYEAGCNGPLSNQTGQQVITNIPTKGHFTRTLEFSEDGSYLYVGVGSLDNTKVGDGLRAVIVRYPVAALESVTVYPDKAETVGTGLRNSVGIRFEPSKGAQNAANAKNWLWTVDNGADSLSGNGYPSDANELNPAEELNILDLSQASKWYGYPQCFTEWDMQSMSHGRGAQWPWPNVQDASMSLCGGSKNTRPSHVFPSHIAPLDLAFYQTAGTNPDSLPKEWVNSVFVTSKGSWNPFVPRGYKVYRVPRDAKTGLPGPIHYDVFGQVDPVTKCPNNPSTAKDACIRPVGLAMDNYGRLWVSIESLGQMVRVSKDPNAQVTASQMNINPEDGSVVTALSAGWRVKVGMSLMVVMLLL